VTRSSSGARVGRQKTAESGRRRFGGGATARAPSKVDLLGRVVVISGSRSARVAATAADCAARRWPNRSSVPSPNVPKSSCTSD